MNDKIKVVKNFIDAKDIEFVMAFADRHIDSPDGSIIVDQIDPDSSRPLIRFGGDGIPGNYNDDFAVLPQDEQTFFETFSHRVVSSIKEAFQDSDDVYIANLWVSRQYAGSKIDIHEDTDGGINDQYFYSSIVYLNTLENEGHLVFDELGESIHPEAGDLIVFLTKGTGRHHVDPISSMRYSIPMVLTKDIKYKLPY